jgi:glycosyltransferase involved in cell wall biosynthesis
MGPGTTVVRIPPGVYRADESVEPPLRSPTESLNIVVMGDGRLDRYYEALMEGMVRTRAKLPHAMYFFYSVDADQHAIWQHARRLDLLNQITLVPVDPATRDLMIRADVMIQPQPLGRARTLILEAMAAGRPIIATEDPVLDYLRANETAALMPHAVPDAWATLLAQLVIEPARFIALGESARQYVNTHHTASQFIARTMELYQQVVTPTALPFPK